MIALSIIFLTLIATCHFIYDGIILPSIRQHYRNRIFALRDTLRWALINDEIAPEDLKAFNLAHDAVNNFSCRLPMLTLSVQAAVRDDIANNPHLKAMIEKRLSVLESCQNQTIKQVMRDLHDILERTYIANAGGWFIYIIPVAIIAGVIKTLADLCTDLSVMPSQEVCKIIPNDTLNAQC